MLFTPAARGRSGRRLPHSSSCSWCLADAAARNETRLEEQACPVAKAPSPPLQSCHSFVSLEEVRTAMLEKALPGKVGVWVRAWVWAWAWAWAWAVRWDSGMGKAGCVPGRVHDLGGIDHREPLRPGLLQLGHTRPHVRVVKPAPRRL